MEIGMMLVNQIAAMAIMVLAGFGLAKRGLLTGEQTKVISAVLLYVIIPCSLIDAFNTRFEPEKVQGMLVSLLLAVAVFALFLAVGTLLGKRGFTPGEVCCLIYSNCGNLIIPIVTGVLGAEYVIYSCAYMLVQNLLTWTHARMVLGGEADLTVKKVVTNPCVLSILVGLVLFLMRIELSGPLGGAIEGLGGCIGPLFMLVTGVLLAEADVKGALSSRWTYLVLGLRLILLPLSVMGLLWAAGQLWADPRRNGVLMVLLLCASGPPATTLAQIAQMFGSGESRYISTLTAVSTVLSAVTMPVMCLLLQMVI